MKNPFKFGTVVSDEQFCNRKNEIQTLNAAIESLNSLWLYSPRRFGKTSLVLKSFEQIHDVKCIYFDLFSIRDSNDFMVKYLNLLTKELFTMKLGVEQILKKTSSLLKNVSPNITLDSFGNPTIGINFNSTHEEVGLTSILDFPEQINYNKPICIAFDEFQEVERIDPFLKNIMRSIFQKQNNVSYIFLGSKESLMNSIFTDLKSPFYQFGEKMTIAEIEKEELQNYIRTMFEKTRVNISENIIQNITNLSDCHPHYTQYFASVVWDMSLDRFADDNIFINDVIKKIIANQEDMFRVIWEQLTKNQKSVLYGISKKPIDGIMSNNAIIEYGLPVKSTVESALRSLMTKNILLKKGSIYRFDNPIFRIWVSRIYD